MTKSEIRLIGHAFDNLADVVDTLTGAERVWVVQIMQKLSDMTGGPRVDIEACLQAVDVETKTQLAADGAIGIRLTCQTQYLGAPRQLRP